jgi:signal transduction histidine kinase
MIAIPFHRRLWNRLSKPINRWRQHILKQLQPAPDSADYRAWRHRFMLDRLSICLWVAIVLYTANVSVQLFQLFFDSRQIQDDLMKFLGDATLFERLKITGLVSLVTVPVLLMVCGFLMKSRWGRRHPEWLFLGLSFSVNLIPAHIIPTVFGIPNVPDIILFMAQAILMPVYWRLHLISQLIPIAYYIGVYPILGLTNLGNRPIYDSGVLLSLVTICLICNLGVYLYERLKRSEFEAQRRLQIFFHTISHDLRTPVIGASMLLRSLLPKAEQGQVQVKTEVIEQLAEGSDRLLDLMNALLDAHVSEVDASTLNRKPVQMRSLVDSVLTDLHPLLERNRIRLINHISTDLPTINVDPQHIWRVWCNLINNALKHNPPNIQLTIHAELIHSDQHHPKELHETAQKMAQFYSHSANPLPKIDSPSPTKTTQFWLFCSVQDTGIGITPEHCSKLFELYTRGSHSRYIPGLGLGLYVCRQIITAHQGQIGAISQPGQGSMFWFALPLEVKD